MKIFTLAVFFALFLGALAGTRSEAQTINAASCNTTDVQNAINSAPTGGTVNIPAGTCTWTSGVTISGKGITVNGAGSSRIIAISSTQLSLSTGTQTLTIQGADPGNPTSAITTGETLDIQETGTEANFIKGTVTSFNASNGQLTINATSDGGSCGSNSLSNCKRWLISTVPSNPTVIVNNAQGSNMGAGGLFSIMEDTSVHTSLGNIQVVPGSTYQDNVIQVNYTSGGQAVLIHDMRITGNPNLSDPPDGNPTMIVMNTNRGVIWNCSFDSSPYNISTLGAITIQQDAADVTDSWDSQSNMGSLDTTGQGKVYAEDNDFHAMNYATSTDNNARAAWRYNLYDNAGVGTHGADTSYYGQRYFEFYDNVMVFEPYTDGTTFNVGDWFFLRGGTGLIYNNQITPLVSQDYGTKSDVNMTVMNLQRSGGPTQCWGAGHSTPGQYYHAPRQVGYGYVTGKGTATYPPDGDNDTSKDSYAYVGDSEPFYIWGNSRNPLNVYISDYGAGQCSSPDSSSNYIVQNRDYFNGTTAKPGWSPYTYPHPLRGASSAPVAGPPAPTGLTGVVAAVQ